MSIIHSVVAEQFISSIALRIASGQQTCARRRARRGGDVEVCKSNTLSRQPVEVRRLYLRIAIGADVTIPEIIGNDDHNIGTLTLIMCIRTHYTEQRGKQHGPKA